MVGARFAVFRGLMPLDINSGSCWKLGICDARQSPGARGHAAQQHELGPTVDKRRHEDGSRWPKSVRGQILRRRGGVMTNRWDRPAEIERQVRARGICRISCAADFTTSLVARGVSQNWGNIINDASRMSLEHIALFCVSDASEGTKSLKHSLPSAYYWRRHIFLQPLTEVAKMPSRDRN